MNAPNERYRLSRYVDGEGSPLEQEETRRRLTEDEGLRTELSDLQAQRRVIKLGRLSGRAPADLSERVLARLSEEATPSAVRETPILPLVRRLAIAAAVLFFVAAAGLFWLKEHRGTVQGELSTDVEAGPPTIEFVPPSDHFSDIEPAYVSPLGSEASKSDEDSEVDER
ncbi:MAG: hypothetical protein RL885_06640 [Planctomycetota bacterium]